MTLIAWDSFVFDNKTIIYLSILFFVTYALNIIGPKYGQDKIERLETDVAELKEYGEE